MIKFDISSLRRENIKFYTVGLAAWFIPAVGFAVSVSGLATSATANTDGRDNIAVLSRSFAVFGITAALTKFIICLVR